MRKFDNCTILFDFDMTLGYRILMWTATVKELLLEENIYTDEENIRPFTHGKGYPWTYPELSHDEFFNGENWKNPKIWWKASKDFIIKGILENGICDKEKAIRVANKFPQRYCDLSYWRVFSDSKQTLKSLKENGARIGILSNHVPEARQIINSLGFSDYVDFMILSAEEEYEKPNIKLFEKAIRDIDKTKCVMIGDHYDVDVLGALNAGIKAILVRKPNEFDYPYYCKDFSNLEKMVETVLQR